MEKITLEDFYRAKGLKTSRPIDPTIMKALTLQVGEGMKIGLSEWNLLTEPSMALNKVAIRRGIRFQTKTLDDGTGWLVLRYK